MEETKVSLYNLTTEMLNLQTQLIESADNDGVVNSLISNALEVKEKEFTEKAVAVATVYRKFENEIALYEQEIERLTAYKKRLEQCKNRVKQNLLLACDRAGVEKISGMYANISFRESKSVVIDDISAIPEKYITKTVQEKPSKQAIAEDLKNGIEVQGAHLEINKNIVIK